MNSPQNIPLARLQSPAPASLHVGESELPFVPLANGALMQLLHADLGQNMSISRIRMAPGCQARPHYHSGSVFNFTTQGCWYYKEAPDARNGPGSFMFEPAGSVHTLVVPADQDRATELWSMVYGSILILDQDNRVAEILDARSMLSFYRRSCESLGTDSTRLHVVGEA